MSNQRRFEGTNLEALLEEVRSTLGNDAHIVAANRVRKGGVGGFFAREHFEVIAAEPEATIDLRPPVRLGRNRRDSARTPADRGRSVPRSVLDLVEERNEEERLVRAIDLGEIDAIQAIDTADIDWNDRVDPAPPAAADATWAASRDVPIDALPVDVAPHVRYEPAEPAEPARPVPVAEPALDPQYDAPRVSTESERFAQILERLAHSTEHRNEAAGYVPTPSAPGAAPAVDVQQPEAASAPPAAAASRVVSLVDAERELLARPPRTVAPPAPATASAPAHTARHDVEETIERPEQKLVRLGLPARFVPRGMAGSALRTALVESLDRLPRATELPKTKGVVVAIVGIGARPVLLGRSVSEELGLDPDEVVVATQTEIDGVPAWLQITEPEAADERRRSWRRRDHLTFVAISQPSLTAAAPWAGDMLDRLEPTQLWGLASAGWKPEDVDAWSRRLGGFDMLALDRLVDTVSPASMLSLGLPIGRLDADAATPERWADELLARIGGTEPVGAGSARGAGSVHG